MFFNTWNYSVQDNLFNRITSDNSLFLKYLQNYSKTDFLGIIPDRLELQQMKIVRCIMPKLLDMCFPAFPKVNHPRLKNERIIKVPHALP